MQAKGFALVELMVSIMILSIITVLSLTAARFSSESFYVFPSQYTRIKSEALLTGDNREYDDETPMSYPDIRFRENGTVNQARTLTFPGGFHERTVIIELGPGTLVFR